MEGFSAWGRDLGGRKVVLWFRRKGVCLPECLEAQGPSDRVCDARGAWKVMVGSVHVSEDQ